MSFSKIKAALTAVLLLVVLFPGCSDFYSSMGTTGTAGVTGTGGGLPGNGLLLNGYPQVNDIIPPAGASIWYDFSQEMNTNTFNTANIQICYMDNNPIATGYSITIVDAKRFRIDGLALAEGTYYKIIFGPNLQYSSGTPINQTFEIPFSTSGGTGSFYMMSSYPYDGQTGIPLSPTFNITFSAPLNTSTFTNTTVLIHNTSVVPATPLSGYTFTFSADYKTGYINGLALSPDSSYQITLTTGIKDTSGNSLGAETYLNFTTISGDMTPPQWTAGYPNFTDMTPKSAYASSRTASIAVSLDEGGIVYWKAVPASGTAPTLSELTGSPDGTFMIASGSTSYTMDITLTSGEVYKIYMVARDNNNNFQSMTTNLFVAAPSLRVYQTGDNTVDVSGDDATYKYGAPLPTSAARFFDQGNGTVLDTLTGLTWTQAPTSTTFDWNGAMNYANTNTSGGGGWRLPNVIELTHMIAVENTSSYLSYAFTGVDNQFWTSTTCPNSTSSAMLINPCSIAIYSYPKTGYYYPVWLVKGDSMNTLPRSGQAASYQTGDDFDAASAAGGLPLPDEATRFYDHGNGTFTDRMTGLTWSTTYLSATKWSTLIGNANSFIGGGYDDWRLANYRELSSLYNWKQADTISWLNSYVSGSSFPGNTEFWTSSAEGTSSVTAYSGFEWEKGGSGSYGLLVRGGTW